MPSFLPDFSALDEKDRKVRLLRRLLLVIFFINIPTAIHLSLSLDPLAMFTGIGAELLSLLLFFLTNRRRLNAIVLCINIAGFLIMGISPLFIGDLSSINLGIIAIFLVVIYNATTNTMRLVAAASTIAAISTARWIVATCEMPELTSPLIQDLILIFSSISLIFSTLIYYHTDIVGYRNDLQRAFQFLKYISDVNPHFIFAKDKDRNFLFANKAGEDWFGIPKEAFIGKQDREIGTFQGEEDPFQEDDLNVLQHGSTRYINRTKITDQNGRVRWLNMVKTPIRDEHGDVQGLFGVATDISQLVHFQEDLTKSEQRYRNIFENSPVGLAIHKQGAFQRVNQALAKMTGYGPQELIETPLEKIVESHALEEIQEYFEDRGFQHRMVYDRELVFYHKEGQEKHAQVRIAPVVDLKGNFIESLVSVSDITEIKSRDLALANSLSQLEITFDNIQEGICVTDTTGNLLRYNQKYFELLQLTPELINGSVADRVQKGPASRSKDPQAYVKRLVEIVSKPEDPSKDVLHYIDGSVIERYSFPQRIGNKTVGRVWSFRDITEQQAFERVLQESEEKYRILFDQAPIGLILVDTEKTKVGIQCNRQMERIFKYTEAELVAGNMLTFSPYYQPDGSNSKEKLHQLMLRYRKNFAPMHFDWQFLDADGIIRDCDVTFVPIRIRGEVLTMIMVHDITDQKLQQRTIQQQVIDLNRQNHQLTEFSYIISHNFRSSVANIQGLTETFDEVSCENPSNVQIIHMVAQMANRLDQSIKDLHKILDVQRTQQDDFERVDLPGLLYQIIEEMSPQVVSAQAKIDIQIPLDTKIQGIRAYFHSIFYNLLSNAIKYHHPDRPPHIRISGGLSGANLQLTVQDNGLGIDLNRFRGQIFSLYKRFHDHVEGKGLGLYLVKAQTEAMGGNIKLESEVDVGSTFTLSFQYNRK
ncbi:MAG: PAS domain-containing sensor histidine kinase [Bacteroidota bacterium]